MYKIDFIAFADDKMVLCDYNINNCKAVENYSNEKLSKIIIWSNEQKLLRNKKNCIHDLYNLQKYSI